MKKCIVCEWLDYYPPLHRYLKNEDGKHRCYLAGGCNMNINEDTAEEMERENLQHVCSFRKKKIPVQLNLFE